MRSTPSSKDTTLLLRALPADFSNKERPTGPATWFSSIETLLFRAAIAASRAATR
eukprot:CAMPEP_0180485736 /NCGR_PEP_ID=MMETSP1036_2-20121128/36629_1 /TAXON_ID=632150 /ORGANISM="Azadinium spinosum, Strain 3D9" /LENGTH=54 /DNA_ID=CAMNT_0022493659 /DNA_START=165 /DNA_END=325 /DNA_ORIENTATION=-